MLVPSARGGKFTSSLADLDRHLGLHHVEALIQWGCLHCDRSFPKLHEAKCHIPKCSGTRGKKGAYKCEACPMSFGTQRGLSTHERHAHPAVSNAKRMETTQSNKVWTVEEVTLLRELEEVYKDHRFPNKEISKILTTKSIDQIKYKRKCLRISSEEASTQEVSQETEVGCDLVDSGNVRIFEALESNVVTANDESTHQWRLNLISAIESPTEVPPSLEEVTSRFMKIWPDFKGNKEALIANIDKFINTSLYRALDRNKKNDESKKKP